MFASVKSRLSGIVDRVRGVPGAVRHSSLGAKVALVLVVLLGVAAAVEYGRFAENRRLLAQQALDDARARLAQDEAARAIEQHQDETANAELARQVALQSEERAIERAVPVPAAALAPAPMNPPHADMTPIPARFEQPAPAKVCPAGEHVVAPRIRHVAHRHAPRPVHVARPGGDDEYLVLPRSVVERLRALREHSGQRDGAVAPASE